MTRELLPGELSWADSFIIDLLSDAEEHQEVIKDLTNSAVMDAIAAVAETSEEIALGFLGDYHRATSSTSHALVEIDEDVDEDVVVVTVETDDADKQADEETTNQTFITNRYTSHILIEVNADIDKAVQQIK
ncbi:unnamed protein product, partial [marine sediment metagenome]